ncbi:MAG: insulinase family protein [Leptolyngbya sp. UWPOB_LEPTO1]|uniref:M16 family metallopeptidase n=1 Tax=Leptolyngbya sp. UWPOB_LEPTO1 TaxID=2815653 RepID=UPI001AC3D860|nr:pitrilysin family protein [Leptolyngbya sp. UWPOB_LEPTO1]MBN8562519.1 insulinase family protein [Leptolyngbya sp. UWPOB_LEPTO1]
MSFLKFFRHHRLFSGLFTLCLGIVLLSNSVYFGKLEAWASSPAIVAMTTTDEVRKTVLDNGLTVLTKEVPTAPVVTVQVWYRIGSRDEATGVNGIAHQLEHLMFKGTSDRPIQFGRLFNALGSQSNAFTSYDQTAYFGTVERDKLRSLLVLEADRMQNALITADSLTSEKRVVISELQGNENSPNYRLSRAVMRAAFPNSPYGLPVGGTKADVEKFSIEQVRSYYSNYYSPENATVIIVGDFKTEPTLQAVKDSFGKVPKKEKQPVQQQAQPVAKPVKPAQPIVLREPGSAPLLNSVYPLPKATHPDVPALHVLDLVLTQGRSSRLYQALVETGLVSGFSGYPANMISGGWYDLSATAAPDQDLNKISAEIEKVLSNVRSQGVTQEELTRAKTQLKSSILLKNRDITRQAFQLGDDQTTTGDYKYTDRFLAAVDRVSAADLQRVAKTYFAPEKSTIGFFQPTTIDAKAGNAANSGQTTEKFNLGAPVDPAQVAKYLPAVQKSDRTTQALPERYVLPNGLRVLLMRDSSTPTVSLAASMQAGSEFDSSTKAGIAKLTADNLTNGTQTKDALTLAKTLEDRGIELGIETNRESVLVNASALSEHLPVLVQTLADVAQNATFPDRELELARNRALSALKVQLDNPAVLARRVFQQAVYPENHPFHSFPTETSLKAIQRQDVLNFYQTHYRPDRMILSLVGDFDLADVKTLVEKELGGWKASGAAPALTYPPLPTPSSVVRRYAPIPGKTQSVTLIGSAGIDRRDARFYNASIVNQVLGGDTLSSRLGAEVRDRQGLTYGIYSYFQAGNRPGPFVISMQTAPEDADKAIASTVKLLEQVREKGVSTVEVLTAQRSITSSYPVDLANPDQLASEILMNETYGLNPAELRQFPNQIESVTQAQVNQAAQELIRPEQLIIVTAGPPKS